MAIEAPAKADLGSAGLNFTDILSDCLACALIAADDRREITAFNAVAETLTGLPAAQLLRQPLHRLPRPLADILQQSLTTGQPVQDRHVCLPAANGPERAIRVNVVPTLTPEGKISGVVAAFNDLSSAQDLERNMRWLDRLASIGTLSASMAHEMKNALVGIKTFLELLVNQNPDAELAGLVHKEVRRIDAIISQMLRFAGPAKPTFARIRLNKLLDHSLRVIQYQLEKGNITLKTAFADPADWVLGDHYQLEQAFLNLFLNAIEAMGPGGQLTVATEISAAAPAQIRVSIKDTGQGIAPENQGRLFEPFFTTKPNGTGLGLSITRRIIQEHDGSISVETQPNRGTGFTLVFPLAPRE